jgi:replication factor C subunit 1
MSPFDVATKLFMLSSGSLSLSERVDMVFQDSDLVPLLVQENYVNYRSHLAGSDLQMLQVRLPAALWWEGHWSRVRTAAALW